MKLQWQEEVLEERRYTTIFNYKWHQNHCLYSSKDFSQSFLWFRCEPEILSAPILDFSWFTGYFFLPKLIKIQTPIYLTRGVWNPHLGNVKLIGKEKNHKSRPLSSLNWRARLWPWFVVFLFSWNVFPNTSWMEKSLHWNHEALAFPIL